MPQRIVLEVTGERRAPRGFENYLYLDPDPNKALKTVFNWEDYEEVDEPEHHKRFVILRRVADKYPIGTRVRTLIDDCDTDENYQERKIPAGTIGTIAAYAGVEPEDELLGLADHKIGGVICSILWNGGGWTNWTEAELDREAEVVSRPQDDGLQVSVPRALLERILDLGTSDIYTDADEYEPFVENMADCLCALGKVLGGVVEDATGSGRCLKCETPTAIGGTFCPVCDYAPRADDEEET